MSSISKIFLGSEIPSLIKNGISVANLSKRLLEELALSSLFPNISLKEKPAASTKPSTWLNPLSSNLSGLRGITTN